MAEEEDRISSLPDFLLLEIISRLPTTKHVIKTTSTLSKRWQHLWTLLPTLIFIDRHDIIEPYDSTDYTDYFSFIDRTLTKCPTDVKLKKFKLRITYNSEKNNNTQWLFHINSWTGYAITRNVQEVYLDVRDLEGQVWYNDELLFNNSCITSMTIVNCFFDPPNGGIRWDKLKSLCMVHVLLGEDVIANILSTSPALESLNLYNCYGFERIDVTSRSVKNLEFSTFHRDPWEKDYMDSIIINAPYIMSLTIKPSLCLGKLLLLNVSSLVKVDLDYSNNDGPAIEFREDIVEEEMLKGLLQSLGHVNEITLGDYCFKVLSRLEATGFQFRKGSEVTSSGRRKRLFLINS